MITTIDFSKNGGFRLKQFTLAKLQQAYTLILKMFVSFCNVPEVGNFIISGCKIDGLNITAGFLYINGELCKFEQTAGTLESLIKKKIVIQTLAFENGSNESVYKTVSAEVDALTGTRLIDFVRVSPVFDPEYTHTDNNFSDIDLAHLDSIEPGAQVNIKPSWTAAAGTAQEILNKPNGIALFVGMSVFYGSGPAGDVSGDDDVAQINFPSVGTNNYVVVVQLYHPGTNWNANNDITHVVYDKQYSSFKIALAEMRGGYQSLHIDYVIFAV